MKKTYVEPQINVVTVETRGIICTSGPGYDSRGTTEAGVSSADGRGYGFDDEY